LSLEGSDDGGIEGIEGRVAALREFVVLDSAEQALDVVQLRAVRREAVEVDPALSEIGPGFANLSGTVEADVVEHDDGRDRGRWQFAQEIQEVARSVRRRAVAVRGPSLRLYSPTCRDTGRLMRPDWVGGIYGDGGGQRDPDRPR